MFMGRIPHSGWDEESSLNLRYVKASHSRCRPSSVAAGNQFAPPHAEAYSGALSPGRYFAATTILASGYRDRSSKTVVRPTTPAPIITKKADRPTKEG